MRSGRPRTRIARWTAVLLLALATVVGVQAGVPTPASAAACWQSGCNGKDPQQTGCASGAYNVDSFRYGGSNQWLQGALLELRYSPTCDAAWVRTTGGDCFGMWRPCGAVLETQGGATYLGGPGPGQHWTAMHSYRDYLRGCFTLPNWEGTYSRDGCTGWH